MITKSPSTHYADELEMTDGPPSADTVNGPQQKASQVEDEGNGKKNVHIILFFPLKKNQDFGVTLDTYWVTIIVCLIKEIVPLLLIYSLAHCDQPMSKQLSR